MCDVWKPERTGSTFDGVSASKNAVQEIEIIRCMLKLKQTRFHIGEMLGRFRKERGSKLFHVDLHCGPLALVDHFGDHLK